MRRSKSTKRGLCASPAAVLSLYLVFVLWSSAASAAIFHNKPIRTGLWLGTEVEYLGGEVIVQIGAEADSSAVDSLLTAHDCYTIRYFDGDGWGLIGCDMPFPQPGLIELLLEKCGDYDVVIPEAVGEVEPLFAVYSKKCLPVILHRLQERDLKVRNILAKLKVRKIEEGEINRVDPERLSFFNINTDEELEKAQALLKRMSGSE